MSDGREKSKAEKLGWILPPLKKGGHRRYAWPLIMAKWVEWKGSNLTSFCREYGLPYETAKKRRHEFLRYKHLGKLKKSDGYIAALELARKLEPVDEFHAKTRFRSLQLLTRAGQKMLEARVVKPTPDGSGEIGVDYTLQEICDIIGMIRDLASAEKDLHTISELVGREDDNVDDPSPQFELGESTPNERKSDETES